jgi:uncharacterized protein (DUF302 family)
MVEMGHGNLPGADRRPTISYRMNSGFETAVKRVRGVLTANQLSIAAEFNASRRLRQALGLEVEPCQILFIENPLLLLEATAIDRSSAVFIPLHLVVSGKGSQTALYLLNAEFLLRANDAPLGIRIPIRRMQAQIVEILETIAERTSVPDGTREWDAAEVNGTCE